jgi:hypothetical protein
MSTSLSLVLPDHCQADQHCDRSPCFRAHLQGLAGDQPFTVSACACANHLGRVVHTLARRAQARGLASGQIRVDAIDPPPHDAAASAGQHESPLSSFAFGTIRLTQ